MQMVRICVCHTYADVRHMDMHDLYAFFSFSAEIRKKVEPEYHILTYPAFMKIRHD